MKSNLSRQSSFCGCMGRMVLWVVGFLMLNSCAGLRPLSKPPGLPESVRQLQIQLDRLLQDSLLSQTRVGIKVVSLSSGQVWYARNSQELFHPASNMKLLTTATALYYLGPAYRFNTVLYADSGSISDSAMTKNVYLKGYGDPELTTADLREMAQELKRLGIAEIGGDLVCDDTYFDSLYRGEGWMWDDVSSSDFAPIGALSVNKNCVTVWVQPGKSIGDSLLVHLSPETSYMKIENHGVTVDSTDTLQLKAFNVQRKWLEPENTVRIVGGLSRYDTPRSFTVEVVDAARYSGTLFKEVLLDEGIRLGGGVVKGQVPENALPVSEHRSQPLAVIALHTNKESDNLSAELLLKTLGAELKGPPGTARKGISMIHRFLHSAGLDTTTYELSDGSGVSRYNVVSPDVIIRLLETVQADFKIQPEFLASLPIAGADGTLRKRMKGTPAQNLLRAKTGSLRGVSALSGYTTTADGELLAFSIMMEHFVGKTAAIRNIQDRIGELLSSFSKSK